MRDAERQRRRHAQGELVRRRRCRPAQGLHVQVEGAAAPAPSWRTVQPLYLIGDANGTAPPGRRPTVVVAADLVRRRARAT